MRPRNLRPIALTIGDVSGIGPEVVIRAALDEVVRSGPPVVAFGSARALELTARSLGSPLKVLRVGSLDDVTLQQSGVLQVLDVSSVADDLVGAGRIDASTGRAAYEAIALAASLALKGEISGIVSAPVNKQAMKQAGFSFIDQAGLLAHATNTPESNIVTMVGAGALRAFMVTKHVPLSAVSGLITLERLNAVITAAHETLKSLLDLASPRIIVAALNPHAGEGGLLGREELDTIEPAIRLAWESGISVTGPLPGKTAFRAMMTGECEGVVAMYHDQTAPIEIVHGHAYTLTLGLPVIRASVGHGTAFNIAGQGIADASGMVAAVHLVQRLVACA